MRYDYRGAFLAGFAMITGLFLSFPSQSSGGADQPNIHIAIRNTGTKMILEASIKFEKDKLAWGLLPPDGRKTHRFYDKPISRKAAVSVKIENEKAIEQVVSLRGWNSVPEAKDITIFFDVRTDINKIIVSFLYTNLEGKMIDFRAAASD